MDKPFRILQVLGRLDRGGAETMIMNLYRNIDRDKIQFDFVICTKDECSFTNEIKSLGGRIFSVPRFNFKNSMEFIKAWHDFFKSHKEYKIIHGHLRSTASIYLSIAKKYGLVTIVHSHSTSSGNGFSAFVKNMLQYPIRYIADYLFACSDAAGIWLFGEKACKKANYFILNNAIDAKKFTYDEQKRCEIRKKLNIEDKFVIGHIGAFRSQKNHEFIIDIFNEVYKKSDKAVLLLIGDGELKSGIEKKVCDLNLTHCVIFTGVSAEVSSLLQAMDVFLFPSLYEGLPVVLIEAQATGLVCFVSDTISKESSVTDLIGYYSLNSAAKTWADRIIEYSHGYLRRDTYNDIKNADYDIETTAKWVEEFYLKLADKL